MSLYHLAKKSRLFSKFLKKNRAKNTLGHSCSFLKRKFGLSAFKVNHSFFLLGSGVVVLEIYKLSNAQPFFALVKNQAGITSIVQLTHKVFLGSILRYFFSKMLLVDVRQNGFFLKLSIFKAGDSICNIFFHTHARTFYVRAAGVFAKVLYKTQCGNFLMIELPSGLKKRVSTRCMGVLGRLSNLQHNREVVGSAGFSFLLGRRPSVRGIAMNPVDHPHGGRTNTNKPEVSPWG